MSLEGGKIQCVAFLYGPGKAGRGLILKEPFRVIPSLPQKEISLTELQINARQVYFRFNIDFLNFTLYSFYILWKSPNSFLKVTNKIN